MTLTSITVNIYGEDYHIRSKDDPTYVQKVAEYLDGKLREIAGGASPPLPLSKLAILAGLNIADEYFRLKESSQTETDKVNRMLAELTKLLDEVMES